MKILLVEDEAALASMLNKGLKEAGYEVTVAPDGLIGHEMAIKNQFDVMVLDIMLPGLNGIQLCKQIRRQQIDTPILMLTALGTTENIVAGLDSGADDYLVKPFHFAELEARLRTLIRRKSAGNAIQPEVLQIGNLTLNINTRSASLNGDPVPLTATEYRLLEFMMHNRGRVLSRMELLENVWGIDFNMSTNVVDVYVNYLRKKIDTNPAQKLIHTMIGMGYILKEDKKS
ncbi:DNA-binding response regulator [Niastella koreensis]|uniref:Two component transcriptional regulator, winged helix family n=2 Tax=Niastella koreensis TaxID=354356 RepID=G8TDX6_NIAKG|nr:response regulator transcription factor [Niastella koreensis]AEW02610.1 two component transcriptional regulator, winged helix family [Niastella koreensis GR20-10]OQP54966.1 DNA-binding response regulator [Niastella koreensis]